MKTPTLHKKILDLLPLLVLVLGVVGQPVFATVSLPFYDNFASTLTPDGGLLTNVDSVNWTNTGTQSSNIIVATSYAQSYSDLLVPPAGSKGAHLTNNAVTGAAGVQLATAISSGSVYASFLLKMTTATSGSRVIWEMNSSSAGAVSSPPFGITLNSDSTLSLFKNGAITNILNKSSALTLNTTYLVAVRYTINGSVGTDDTLDLWLNPAANTLGSGTAPTANIAVVGGDSTNADVITTGFKTASFGLLTSTGGAYDFDEFRLGTTWAAVTPASAPNVPTGLSALGANSQVTISWTASAADAYHPNATGYNIKRSTTSGGGYITLSAGTNVAVSPFVDATAVNGTTYYYVVTAVSSVSGTTESSNTIQVTATPSNTSAPATAPTISSVIASCSSLTLTWVATADTTGYNVYRKISGGSYGSIVANLTGTSYVDSSVVAGTSYVYAVTSTNSNGENPTKNDSVATNIDAVSIVGQPSNVTAADGSINTSFSVVAMGASLAYQWQTNNGSSYVSVGAVNGGTTANYTLPTLIPGYQGLLVQCVVSGSCGSSVTSSPAILSVATHFRSQGNNLSWASPAGSGTWQISVDGTTGWVNSTNTPTLSDSVEIQSGHLIKIATLSNAKCLNLTIDSGGTNQFTGSSTHRRLFIAGNLTNNGTINTTANATDGLSHIFEFTTNGTWSGSGNISKGGIIGFTNELNTTLTLATSDGITLNSSTPATIGVGGTLNAGTNVLTINSGIVVLAPAAMLLTANNNGFYGNNTNYTLNNNGGTPTLSITNGSIIFDGTDNQFAAGLTGTIGNLIIANTGGAGHNSVAFDSGSPVIITELRILSGLLNPNGLTTSVCITLSYDAASVLLQPAGTYGNFGSGAFYASGSHFSGSGYITVANGPKWFKSNTSGGGNWSVTATWLESVNNGASYAAATDFPNSYSGKIEILAGDSVTNDIAGQSMDNVTVDANGKLVVNPGIAVTLGSGNSPDLSVNGTFLNQGNVTWSGTWALNANGTYIHYNTNAGAGPYNAATVISPSSTYRYRGSATVGTPLATGGRTYGNLVIESADGTQYATSASSANVLTVNGDFTLGSNVVVTNGHTGAWVFNGNFTANGNLVNTNAEIYTFSGTGKTISGSGSMIPFVTWNISSGASITLATSVTAVGGTLAGNLLIPVNKSVSPSNTAVTVSGNMTNTGTGSIIITNQVGAPGLVSGDRFVIFSNPVQNGNAMTISGGSLSAGLVWSNNLSTDGSVSVSSAVITPPVLGVSTAGNALTFTWTGAFKLQSQTNSLNAGLSATWYDYPGGGSSGVSVLINPAKPTVFFRLAQ